MRYDVPIFDPIRARGEDHFHPIGDAASHLVHITFTYNDIARLFSLLNRTTDEYEVKLLTKFAIVEWVSLDSHIDKLAGLVLSGKADYPINDADITEIGRLYGSYKRGHKRSEDTLLEIRNKIAAHRETLDLIAVARIWDGVDVNTLYEVIKPLPELVSRLNELNIYRWSKSELVDGELKIANVAPMVWDALPTDSEEPASPTPDSAQQATVGTREEGK